MQFSFYVDIESLAIQLLVDFAISDQAYAKAKIPVTDSVNLWLGANVMLEYPLEEAKSLLVSLLLLLAHVVNTSVSNKRPSYSWHEA